MANSPSGDSALGRFVRILAAFDPQHPALTTTQLAARAGLPASTAYRLVGDMLAYDLLEKDADGRLRIGVGMWELANRTSEAVALADVARPLMHRVHDAIGQLVQLSILREREILVIERLAAPDAIENVLQIGGRLPVHASSAGLVLLAFAPRQVQEAHLRPPLPRVTDETVTDPAQLRSLLAWIRTAKVAELPGHMVADSTGIAVPVLDPRGNVVAALGAVQPTEGLSRTRVISALREATEGITAELTRLNH